MGDATELSIREKIDLSDAKKNDYYFNYGTTFFGLHNLYNKNKAYNRHLSESHKQYLDQKHGSGWYRDYEHKTSFDSDWMHDYWYKGKIKKEAKPFYIDYSSKPYKRYFK